MERDRVFRNSPITNLGKRLAQTVLSTELFPHLRSVFIGKLTMLTSAIMNKYIIRTLLATVQTINKNNIKLYDVFTQRIFESLFKVHSPLIKKASVAVLDTYRKMLPSG